MTTKPEKVKLDKSQLDSLYLYLVGSCNSIGAGLDTLGLDISQLDKTSFDAIDAMMFLCNICDYWDNVENNTGEDICFDCYLDFNLENDDERDILDYPNDFDPDDDFDEEDV